MALRAAANDLLSGSDCIGSLSHALYDDVTAVCVCGLARGPVRRARCGVRRRGTRVHAVLRFQRGTSYERRTLPTRHAARAARRAGSWLAQATYGSREHGSRVADRANSEPRGDPPALARSAVKPKARLR